MANDSLNNKSKGKGTGRGGARPGAGRKPGVMEKATLDRIRALERYKKRVMKHTTQLLDAQMTLALGVTTLWRIPKEEITKTDKEGNEYVVATKKGKPEMVTSSIMVEKYLAGEFEDDPKADWYFITTDKPDNRALDSMLDRTYGKATQPLSAADPNAPKVGVVIYRPEKLPDAYDAK